MGEKRSRTNNNSYGDPEGFHEGTHSVLEDTKSHQQKVKHRERVKHSKDPKKATEPGAKMLSKWQ